MRYKRIDTEDLATSEVSLFDTLDLAATGTVITLELRGNVVGYLIGKDTFRELKSRTEVSQDSLPSIALKLLQVLILDHTTANEAEKKEMLASLEDVGDYLEP